MNGTTGRRPQLTRTHQVRMQLQTDLVVCRQLEEASRASEMVLIRKPSDSRVKDSSGTPAPFASANRRDLQLGKSELAKRDHRRVWRSRASPLESRQSHFNGLWFLSVVVARGAEGSLSSVTFRLFATSEIVPTTTSSQVNSLKRF